MQKSSELQVDNNPYIMNIPEQSTPNTYEQSFNKTSPQMNLVYSIATDSSYTNILLIDNSVKDYQIFVDSVNSTTLPIVYSRHCSSFELLTILRTHFYSITRIGVCFEMNMNSDSMFLNNEPFFQTNESNCVYNQNVQFIQDIIKEFNITNIDFLACNTLNYANWKNYYDVLTQSTGVIVGASDNKTGNLKYGGDWILESTAEDIESVYFTKSIEYYSYLLALANVTTIPSAHGAFEPSRMEIIPPYCFVATWYRIVRLDLTDLTKAYSFSPDLGPSYPRNSSMTKYNGNLYVSNYDYNYSISPARPPIAVYNPSVINTTSFTSLFTTDVASALNIQPLTIFAITAQSNNLYILLSRDLNPKVCRICRVNLSNPNSDYGNLVTINLSTNQTLQRSVTSDSTYIYFGINDSTVNIIYRINYKNITDISSNWASGFGRSVTLGMTIDDYGYMYGIGDYGRGYIGRINMNNFLDVSYTWWITPDAASNSGFDLRINNNIIYAPSNYKISTNDVPIGKTYPKDISLDSGNTFIVTNGNVKVTITDSQNVATDVVYYYYSVSGDISTSYINSNKLNTGPGTYNFFINTEFTPGKVIYVIAKNTVSVSNPVSFTLNNNIFANTFVYVNTNVTLLNNITQYSFSIPNLTGKKYIVYLRAKNNAGVSTPTNSNLVVMALYNPPFAPTIDTGNTKSLTSGNLTVTITDTQNSSTNSIYYLYSMDGNTYGNSGVTNTGNTKYSFTINDTGNSRIPLVANTYTLYVAASNPFANAVSTPFTVPVYTTPISPTIDVSNTQSLTSGNLTVFIRDASNSPTNGIYYLYSMDGGVSYGNSGVAKTANTTYTFTINNTGNAQVPLVANTYTLRIAASNPIGNSIASPATAIESVYTNPLSSITIDASNTQCTTSGNLTVVINDTVNSSANGIYYLYSMDGGVSYGNSGVPKTAGNTIYTFTINNTGNTQIPLIAKTYTLYIAASNPIGNTILNPATAIESVYTTPLPPTINQGNTKSITSGNLNVGFTDTLNVADNQVEYTYFMYDSTAAPLFFV